MMLGHVTPKRQIDDKCRNIGCGGVVLIGGHVGMWGDFSNVKGGS